MQSLFCIILRVVFVKENAVMSLPCLTVFNESTSPFGTLIHSLKPNKNSTQMESLSI